MNLLKPHDIWPPHDLYKQMANVSYAYLDQVQTLSIKDGSGVIAQFENMLTEYYGVKYAIGLNSGTSAVHSALFAVGIQDDDEVICQVSTFHASITPLMQTGGIPVLCDTDGSTGNIDIEDVKNKITDKTKAIIVTHMWGYPADMDEIMEIANQHNLFVIEDCSHAHGTVYKGRKTGTIGHIGVFSMQASKIVPAGEGGYLITSDRNLYERALLFGQFGERLNLQLTVPDLHAFWETGMGLKYRMHPLAAVCAIVAFKHFAHYLRLRRKRIHAFHEYIKDIPALNHLIEESPLDRYSYFMNRMQYEPEHISGIPIKSVVKDLRELGLDIRIASHRPLYHLPVFQGKRLVGNDNLSRWPIYTQAQFPKTVSYFESLLGLPRFDHPEGDRLVEYYGQTLRQYFLKR
ncbi:DegT/DnrJ/EryC1/StrS family aminotransferase [Paenibacillus ginsengihumi]|uniref:DegT/DnrJ/EryC1/StrS aminotransferase family protein n=1 Tax=Paenibacillus ginsengihumi TaxID=431596 RepID=UPI000363A679|nr:DegT/DnrJ/EryC1/StrS family aminotransferase [Paenibacillus ginsengihumi]